MTKIVFGSRRPSLPRNSGCVLGAAGGIPDSIVEVPSGLNPSQSTARTQRKTQRWVSFKTGDTPFFNGMSVAFGGTWCWVFRRARQGKCRKSQVMRDFGSEILTCWFDVGLEEEIHWNSIGKGFEVGLEKETRWNSSRKVRKA